ncbi:hypothetical protein ACOSQ2_009175 [Xanthoceras sorbifolium]
MSSYGDPYKKQKKNAVIFVSLFLLISVVLAVTIGITVGIKATAKEVPKNDNIAAKKAIIAMCAPTDYQDKCVKRLETHAGNTSDPKELVRVVFKIALKHIRRAGNTTVMLKEIEKDRRANSTLQGCKELMHKSIRELKRSCKELQDYSIKKDSDKLLGDLMIWLSATLTYQETCLDGFDDRITSPAADKMRATLRNSIELTRNGIAMVSTITQVLDLLKFAGQLQALGVGNRRLLQEEDDNYAELVDDFLKLDGDGEHIPVVGHGKRRRLLNQGEKPINPALLQNGGNRTIELEQVFDIAKFKPHFVVAKDGSGRFTTITDALMRVPRDHDKPIVVYVKEGVYNEIVHILPDMINLVLIGEGAEKTRITGSLNYDDGVPTWKTATFAVSGEHFTAKNIAFENTAGPAKHQAAALRVDSDRAIFYNCTMDGFQNTLHVHAKRQFYRDCNISGTVDFVFGDGSAVFQNCKFIIRKPLENQNCTVTAQGRNYTYQPTAIVIQNSTITADLGFLSVKDQHKVYLGRPAREYSRTIIMESFIDGVIDPQGWLAFDDKKGTDTCFYTEFDNHGPGANKTQRVQWQGIKNISSEEAQQYTAGRIIGGDDWITTLAVPYTSGLFSNQTADHHNNTTAIRDLD